MTDTPLSDELLARVGEAAENACLSEMSWPEIGSAALEAARYGEMQAGLERAAENFERLQVPHIVGSDVHNFAFQAAKQIRALLSSIGASHE